MGWGYDYKPYVSVAERRAQAAREVAKRVKKGETVSPVVIEGRVIASTFWGKAWCENLESYSDYDNRLPRGRTYVRNGSVVDLKIEKGKITALVSGSELYTIRIDIAELPAKAWQAVKKLCSGKIGSLVELLRGKLSTSVMQAVTDRSEGLFPKPKEIKMRCSCPDDAGLCKHLAAVMYGIGNRLDSAPEMLFQLRGVDHQELIEEAIPTAPTRAKKGAFTIEAADLGAIFDIELNDAPATEPTAPKKAAKVKKAAPKAAVKDKKVTAATKTAKVKAAAPKAAVMDKKATAATKTAKVKAAAPKAAVKDKKATSTRKKPPKSGSKNKG